MSDLQPFLDRLVSLLGEVEGEPEPLEGGITNRNYRATFAGSEHVIRLPGRDTELLGIDRAAEGAAASAAAEAGIAPPVTALLEDPPCLVCAFAPGRQVDEDDLRGPELLETLARTLATLHSSGASVPVAFNAFRVVERYEATARERGAEIPDDYSQAHACAERIEAALGGAGEHEPVLCHNDLLAGNLLVDGDDIRIVDWEYAGMGDRWFDLGNLAVNNGLGAEEEERLLAAYFGEPADERRRATLALMRFMSDFREAMWGVVQGTVSDLDFDFGGYAREHFDRLARTGADERFEGWLEAARG
ncbi:MAG TPA: phosphotransferase [Thermoleophilaceae bacterium]|nr:phosphotransferase [Thermoleophilaceae bacterium]